MKSLRMTFPHDMIEKTRNKANDTPLGKLLPPILRSKEKSNRL